MICRKEVRAAHQSSRLTMSSLRAAFPSQARLAVVNSPEHFEAIRNHVSIVLPLATDLSHCVQWTTDPLFRWVAFRQSDTSDEPAGNWEWQEQRGCAAAEAKAQRMKLASLVCH